MPPTIPHHATHNTSSRKFACARARTHAAAAAAQVEAKKRWSKAEAKWKTTPAGRAGAPRPRFTTLEADLRRPLSLSNVVAAVGRTMTLPAVLQSSSSSSALAAAAAVAAATKAAVQFDTVSCQFALHYMFETPASLFNCLRALDAVVRPRGGFFMATLYSGHAVERFMRQQPLNSGGGGSSSSSSAEAAAPALHEKTWVIDGVKQATITMDPAVVLPR